MHKVTAILSLDGGLNFDVVSLNISKVYDDFYELSDGTVVSKKEDVTRITYENVWHKIGFVMYTVQDVSAAMLTLKECIKREIHKRAELMTNLLNN